MRVAHEHRLLDTMSPYSGLTSASHGLLFVAKCTARYTRIIGPLTRLPHRLRGFGLYNDHPRQREGLRTLVCSSQHRRIVLGFWYRACAEGWLSYCCSCKRCRNACTTSPCPFNKAARASSLVTSNSWVTNSISAAEILILASELCRNKSRANAASSQGTQNEKRISS